MKSQFIGSSLKSVITRKQLSQKILRVDTSTPATTVSEHVTNKQRASIDKAFDYTRSVSDSRFNLEISSLFFGGIISMTGDKYQQNPLVLDFIQTKETQECLDAKTRAYEILAQTSNQFTSAEKECVESYAYESLDELMVKTTILVEILDRLNVSLMDVVDERMSNWISKGYMRKENK